MNSIHVATNHKMDPKQGKKGREYDAMGGGVYIRITSKFVKICILYIKFVIFDRLHRILSKEQPDK